MTKRAAVLLALLSVTLPLWEAAADKQRPPSPQRRHYNGQRPRKYHRFRRQRNPKSSPPHIPPFIHGEPKQLPPLPRPVPPREPGAPGEIDD